jgi:hypothetical protein
MELVPYYRQMDQTGLDAQLTLRGWLWKLEAIRRTTSVETFTAMVGGVEWTAVGVMGSVVDVGLLAELHLDDRGTRATSPFQEDLFLGTRAVLNDVEGTEILAGLIVDLERGGALYTLESSRRLGDRWRLYVEARGFDGLDQRDPLFGVRRDDVAEVTLVRFF